MSRLGDAELCREAHSNLVLECKYLREIQEIRRRIGRDLQLEDRTALSNFPADEAKALEELGQIEAGVERLRLEVIREWILDESEYESDEKDILEPLNYSVDLEQADYNKYPLLLLQPSNVEDERLAKFLISDFKVEHTGDRIEYGYYTNCGHHA